MIKKMVAVLSLLMTLHTHLHAQAEDGWDFFDMMWGSLKGEWLLIGDNKEKMVFKLIGAETTIQEDLLPDSPKQMVTMYHCKDIACTTLKATHYCVKQNQPEFIANFKSTPPHKIIFDCDMKTELCQSNEDHVHQIIHEISPDGKKLTSSYLSWENKKLKEHSSIYRFERP